ncbi:hypothetical protein M758_10G160300 [Ceratodon purpureus]|nr:hypothetical protein M758_10G160300 [Ceratodon purpureus]
MERRLRLRIWLLAIVTLLAWFAGNTTVALTPDGLALMEFRNGLTIISPLLETWNVSDVSPCSWGGITCTASGDVQSIILLSQVPMLEGNISASLGKLKSLEVLSLDGNLLSGSIPPELGNLSNLKNLSLSFQKLLGEVPLQLANCSSLVELRLNENDLTGDITTVLEALSKLPAIQVISLDGNSFTGTLPPSIGNATTLIYLSLGTSFASGQRGVGLEGQLPKEIGKLVNMTTLWLGGNSFSGEIPLELGNMRLLNTLWLPYNKLNGTIPSWLGNMVNMTKLDLTDNGFVGEIPADLGHMTSLNELGLAKNNLSGIIPSSLGNLVNLKRLDLHTNNLTGPIPEIFTLLINLRVLMLGYNGLTGFISSNMTKTATRLEGVYLQNNSMSGPLPTDFGKFMPNLTVVDIENNFFTGMLPDGLCQGGKLQWLEVGGNHFEGAIPLSLANCPSLAQARLSDNRFTSIPDGFGRNSSLQYVDLSNNQLTGPLPAGLGVGSQVTFIDLSNNNLTGDISILEFFDLAQNLSVLNLAKNNLVGEIPASMAMCKSLYWLDLSYNSLTGKVPLALANLSNLEQLHLQGNYFTSLSPGIYSGSAATLRILNLADNPWNAPIASEIGSLTILQILNLSCGGFRGPIPVALLHLMQLEVLDLSHNDLTGEIPSGLGELMTSLVSVNVSFNQLTGSLPPAWVKFLAADPESFRGNPGLCLRYDVNNVCVEGSDQNIITSSRGKITLSVGLIVGVVFGIALAFVIFVTLLFYLFRSAKIKRLSKLVPKVDRVMKNLTTAPLSFTFDNVMAATENFSDDYIIGRGCHGVVYKATLAKDTHIVVKRIACLDFKTALVHKSFWKEIESIGNAKHRNLVRLLGFMQWGEVGFLLYDYVSNGDLRSALHDKERGLVLNWKERLRIAEGVAQGLAYLHHTYSPPIVHRDISSSNVLLDNDLEAQISDFGLSKVLGTQPKSQQWSSTSPAVLGTYGYIAPEVGYSTKVSTKLDVYSYGVLLLELLTGKKPAEDPSYGESLHVAAWVKEKVRQNEGKMSESVLDPSLLDDTNLACKDEMLSVQTIALLCTRDNPSDRPAMKEVVEMFSELSRIRNKNVLENRIENV